MVRQRIEDGRRRIQELYQEEQQRLREAADKAHYLVQANILQVGKFTKEKVHTILSGSYGSAIEGAAIGAGVGSLIGRKDSTLGGALVGTTIGFAANSLIKDVMYGTVVDVQISEKAARRVKFTEEHASSLKQGLSDGKEQRSTNTTGWKRYQTRIISVANKVNLTEEQATLYLVAGISKSILGIL